MWKDVDNRLGPWFEAGRASVVVIRPDRLVAAVVSPDRLDAVLSRLARQMMQG